MHNTSQGINERKRNTKKANAWSTFNLSPKRILCDGSSFVLTPLAKLHLRVPLTTVAGSTNENNAQQ